MKAANCCGVDGAASTPCSARRRWTSGALSALLKSAFSFATTADGVAAGAHNPYHTVTSTAMPDSSIVGTSGRWEVRFGEVTASARVRLDFRYVSWVDMLSNIEFRCPPKRSTS